MASNSSMSWLFRLIALHILLLWSCRTVYVPDVEHRYYRLDTSYVHYSHAGTDSLIGPYKRMSDIRMNSVIGELSEDFIKAQPESMLGNWLGDLLRAGAEKATGEGIDFAILNYHGIRLPSLQKGPVSLGKIYELLPFDNAMVVVRLDSALIMQLVQNMASRGGWPCSSGLRYVISGNGAHNVRLHGEILYSGQTYRAVMPDFIADGGDGCEFLIHLPRENTGILLRDAVIDDIRRTTESGKLIDARLDGRVRRVQ